MGSEKTKSGKLNEEWVAHRHTRAHHTHAREAQGSHRHIRTAVAVASVELITTPPPDYLDRQFGLHDSGTKSSSAALLLTPCSLHPV